MYHVWGWGLVVSLGMASSVLANELVLEFAYPRGVVVDSFLFTYQVSTDPGHVLRGFRATWTEAPVCKPAQAPALDETHCARPPVCDPSPQRSEDVLGPGVYSFRVQAERGSVTSEGSNWVTCEAHRDCRWDCASREAVNAALLEATADPAPAPSLPPSAPPMPTIDTAALDALAQQWEALDRLIPQPPRSPVLATPPT